MKRDRFVAEVMAVYMTGFGFLSYVLLYASTFNEGLAAFVIQMLGTLSGIISLLAAICCGHCLGKK